MARTIQFHAMNRLLLCGAALLMAGCASRAPAPAPKPTPVPAARAAAPTEPVPAAPAPPPPAAVKPSPLAAEQRWLTQLFDGTPVVIQGESDGSVQLTVPMVHSFDGPSTSPKPALKAVLDKLGQSLKRQPGSRLAIGAPGEAGQQRANAARKHLLVRGVAGHRVSAAPAATDAVVLRLSVAPAPIGRLDDSAPALAKQPAY